ncbi:MAG: B12-binding domain-containing radical SAM protein, partial [Planctomycetota bacterium]
MTYWYPGVAEVIEDIRKFWPQTKIILGGNYASLCPDHAQQMHPDLLIYGDVLEPLWSFIDLQPDPGMPALWEAYEKLDVGALKLSDGCPFKCTYCSVPEVYGKFKARSMDRALAELELLCKLGAKNIAFYDDALLFNAEKVLLGFLEKVRQKNIKINFHSPNALNARFITKPLAEAMINTGFKTFYLGFESSSEEWQKKTGSKVLSKELATAVEHLKTAGAQPQNITAYQILGHPHSDIQELEESM